MNTQQLETLCQQLQRGIEILRSGDSDAERKIKTLSTIEAIARKAREDLQEAQ